MEVLFELQLIQEFEDHRGILITLSLKSSFFN